ncbi:DUF1232 domain-containing protein [Orenia marismortui]|uniref:Uncharacterized protein DUF1232 n=1 Tax=Orenia marismortui TaxID=46469 RepID=A0A4R8H1K4_9FIRM|nr:DUF1232 domain-containing protein [Orenia marismortui]TDX53324.1 uncharacterized protein DUF1232 [Orenia marismortui]
MSKLNKFKLMINNIKLAYKYIRDPKVSLMRKILLIFPLVYILSPVDLIPEILLPLLGWLDDTVIALTIWNYMFNLIRKEEEGNNSEYTLEEDEYKIK